MTEFAQDTVPTQYAEASEAGWGDGHACTADEITEAARRGLTGS
jgi:hypothetical protein